MRINGGYRYLLVLIVLFFAGCATSNINQRVADFQRPSEYVRFFEALDRSVGEADGKDASIFPVSGFPYLRTNRFLTGLKQDLNTDARKEQWIRWLQQLDIEARKKEIRNLPSGTVRELARDLGEEPDRQILQGRVADYSEKLLTHDQGRPDFLSYRLVAYDQLEMLPHSENHYESIFNSRGIAKDSGRIEFLIFFPMGIPDVGSMRQRGHHAVKLVGRSHFEDPDLFDDNFEFY
jgi:hypothetical protein